MWNTPYDGTTGEVITEIIWDTYLKDNLRYLKGLDGIPTIQSGLIISNALGTEYFLAPLLTTAQCTSVLGAEGKLAHDNQTHRIKLHDGTAVRSIVTTADVDDTPANGATTDPISSNWAFDHLAILTTAGDIIYATAAGTWEKLGIGTAGQNLRVNAGATAPEWAASVATKQFFVPCGNGSGGTAGWNGDYSIYTLNSAADYVSFSLRLPNDFTALTSVKIIMIPTATGTFDWTATTDFGANGESRVANSDSATADGQAATNITLLELDISAAYTNVAANDIIGTAFILDALNTTTQIDIVGLDVKYT